MNKALKIILKLIAAIAAGFIASALSNFDAPISRLIIFIGVSVVAFIAFSMYGNDKNKFDRE